MLCPKVYTTIFSTDRNLLKSEGQERQGRPENLRDSLPATDASNGPFANLNVPF
jgi:hypothetical protein